MSHYSRFKRRDKAITKFKPSRIRLNVPEPRECINARSEVFGALLMTRNHPLYALSLYKGLLADLVTLH